MWDSVGKHRDTDLPPLRHSFNLDRAFSMLRHFGIAMLLLAANSIALVQAAMTYVRIIDGVETIISHPMANISRVVTVSPNESMSVSKRWDGSPAYQEYQTAYKRGCT